MVPQVGVLQQFAKEGGSSRSPKTTEQSVDTNYASVWKKYGSVGDTLYGLYFKAAHKVQPSGTAPTRSPRRVSSRRPRTTPC